MTDIPGPRFTPVADAYGRWLAFDNSDQTICLLPIYADEASAQSWCDIRNATFGGASRAEMKRLRERHEEIRKVADVFALRGVRRDDR